MAKKTIGKYQYIDCTATSVSCGDPVEQHSVLIRDVECTWADDVVLFGWTVADIPDTQEEIDMALMGEYTSADYEDLNTVIVDGLPLGEYVSGQL